ncbi:MAG: DUF1963 domain-containing protein [Paenirhodobacter sp.]|uniref:DUF1963 domain-containing protein n=1 Tax=Paenirhodobacter sp. TaxID=1965326 RepID=UPI003D0F4949
MLNWIRRLFGAGRGRAVATGGIDARGEGVDLGTGLAAQWARLSGAAERPEEAPAWSLALRSPYLPWEGARSWFGGLPALPPGRDWPRGGDDLPLHFLAQIALSDLAPEPETGGLPPAPLRAGALLIFVEGGAAGDRGQGGYCALHLDAAEQAAATPRAAPADLPALREAGYWVEGGLFAFWPIDPLPFRDSAAIPAAGPLGNRAEPESWITSWGLAGCEADLLILQIDRKLAHYRDPKAYARLNLRAAEMPGARAELAFAEDLRGPIAEFVPRLAAWRDAALARGDAPIEPAALAAMLAERRALVASHGRADTLCALMRGLRAGEFEELLRISYGLPGLAPFARAEVLRLPAGLRPFLEPRLTGWRGHRLFGLLTEIGETREADRRGQDLLISVAGDSQLGTRREHDFGQSIWVPRDGLARGELGGGQHLVHYSG